MRQGTGGNFQLAQEAHGYLGRSELTIELMPEFHAEPYIYLPTVTHNLR